MISNIGFSPMQGMQQVRQAQPPMPSPDEMLNRGIERLEENVSSGNIDTEELAVKLEERFGEAASGIVGEDGSVDFEALKDLLVQDRNEQLKEGLTEKFGEEAAANVFAEDGSINEDALKELLSSAQPQMAPPPPPTQMSETGEAEETGDFLAEMNGDMPPPPPGEMGGMGGMQGARSSSDSSSLESMLQQFLAQQSEATSYGSQGEMKTDSGLATAYNSLIDFLA